MARVDPSLLCATVLRLAIGLSIALTACAAPPKAPPVFPACDWSEDKPVTVIGEVRKPGVMEFAQNLTAYDALVHAGGFTMFARRTSIHLRRCGREDFRFETPNTKGETLDFKLYPGDTIFVPGGREEY